MSDDGRDVYPATVSRGPLAADDQRRPPVHALGKETGTYRGVMLAISIFIVLAVAVFLMFGAGLGDYL